VSSEAKETVAMSKFAAMKPRLPRLTRPLIVLVMISAGLVAAGSTASAAPVTINLCAQPGTTTLTGAVSVPIWGFGLGSCATATASLPGPVLGNEASADNAVVHAGDTVTMNITNNLPADHTLTFEIPGITFDAGPTDIAAGTSGTVSFTASAPGTYLYQAGGTQGRQAAMGLAGALIVNPATAGQAYEPATTAYDTQSMVVLGAVDPNFNAAPDTFDMYSYHATYWLINGKAYPDTTVITAAPAQRLLLRYVNAGFDNTSMALLGMHAHVVARDAHLLNNPFDTAAETIPAGGTEDAIATVPDGTAPSVHGFPLYNRNLHLTNGPQTGADPAPATGGGMLTFIHP
jgi:FtsP/CotA-like multicopper oxidase with cupredoxin domain